MEDNQNGTGQPTIINNSTKRKQARMCNKLLQARKYYLIQAQNRAGEYHKYVNIQTLYRCTVVFFRTGNRFTHVPHVNFLEWRLD